MPYLRGTKRGSVSQSALSAVRPATLQNQINKLKQDVGKNKPGIEYYREQVNLSHTTEPWSVETFTPTESFIASSDYRNTINGDRFTNHRLRVYLHTQLSVESARLCIYVPKRPDQSFEPPNNDLGFVTVPDPAAFWVLSDNYIRADDSATPRHFMRDVSLRGMITLNNVSSSVLEKGNIKILVMLQAETTGAKGTLGFRLAVTDK